MQTRLLFPLLTALLVLSVAPIMAGAEDAPLDPNLPYQAQRSNPVTYDVDFGVVVTAPYHTKVLKLWLPLPSSDRGQEVEEGTISTFPATLTPQIDKEPVYGNRFAYFEINHPEGGQIIRHQFKIKIWELHWHLDPGKIKAVEQWPSTFDRFLQSDHSVTVNDGLKKLTHEIVRTTQGPVQDLNAVMDWVTQNMRYDHNKASLRASSEHALAGRTGHCSDYHGLCAAFGRSLGYPSRITYGINTFAKNSPSHCKIEAFLPPVGWVSFDVSETQKIMAEIKKAKLDDSKKEELSRLAQERLRKGFRDNTWFWQTRGTDYELIPPASRRVPVVRTIYAEADGVPLPDPDPANTTKREFSWMTVAKFTPNRPVSYPFLDWKSLSAEPSDSR
jgi:transglutaminase-like putative cysteine protease